MRCRHVGAALPNNPHISSVRPIRCPAHARRHGRFSTTGTSGHYRVNPGPLQEISAWFSPHERYWRERLTALGEMLDGIGDEKDT
jgi:hypothetical protein